MLSSVNTQWVSDPIKLTYSSTNKESYSSSCNVQEIGSIIALLDKRTAFISD